MTAIAYHGTDDQIMSKRRFIEITNATFAKIQGKDLSLSQKYNRPVEYVIYVWNPLTNANLVIFARALARPIQSIGNDTFLVPATIYDYLELRQFQSLTEVKGVEITYVEAKPSQLNPWALGRIKVRMHQRSHEILSSWADAICSELNAHAQWWMYYVYQTRNAECKLKFVNKKKKTVSPDAVLFCKDQKFPFFLLEIAVTRTREELLSRAELYLHGTKGHLKILCMLELQRSSANRYRVLVTIWRLRKSANLSLHNMNHTILDVLFDAMEVYPRKIKGCLRITRRDVRPKDSIAEALNDHVDIKFDTLYQLAKAAVAAQKQDDLEAKKSWRYCAEKGDEHTAFLRESDVVFWEGDESDGEDPSWKQFKEISPSR